LILPTTSAPRILSRPLTTTVAPALARVSATASPIPLVEPVTRAVRPSSGLLMEAASKGEGRLVVLFVVMLHVYGATDG
jgi:hypothetical protein